jgi:hypothetical protein
LGSEIEEVAEADDAKVSEGNTGGATHRDIVPEACAERSVGVVEPGHVWRGVAEELGRSRLLRRETEPRGKRE